MRHARKQYLFGVLLLVLTALLVVGCSSDELAHILGGGNILFTPKFAVAANFSDDTLSVYSVNSTTGVLTEVAGSPFDTVAGGPWGVALNQRLGNVFYVASDDGSGVIEAFSVNNSTGAVTSLGSVTAGVVVRWVTSIAVTPTGNRLYAGGSGQLDAFDIGATGALTHTAGFPVFPIPVGGGGTIILTIDPSGKFLYAGSQSDNEIYGYTIDNSTGALTLAPGFPIDATQPYGLFATTHFLYLATHDGNLTGYTINTTTGEVTAIATGFPIALSNPIQIVSNPQQTQLFVVEQTDPTDVDAYTINATTGQLTAAPGSPFHQGVNADGLVVDPSGKFVYWASCSSKDVGAATLGTGAALTTIPGAPFPAGACAASIAVTH
jgi:6-phosphogluconolactonase